MGILNPETKLGYNNRCGFRFGSKEHRRFYHLKGKYGITTDEWNTLFASQGNVCAICGSDEMRGRNWHTDHDHETNTVRGILCCWCNTAIGKLQENADILRSAIAYLKKHKKKKLH